MPKKNQQVAAYVHSGTPWWREPWPWILMAGPAAAIIGCIITIVLAFQSYGDQAISDGGVKQGLVVSKQMPAKVPGIQENTKQ